MGCAPVCGRIGEKRIEDGFRRFHRLAVIGDRCRRVLLRAVARPALAVNGAGGRVYQAGRAAAERDGRGIHGNAVGFRERDLATPSRVWVRQSAGKTCCAMNTGFCTSAASGAARSTHSNLTARPGGVRPRKHRRNRAPQGLPQQVLPQEPGSAGYQRVKLFHIRTCFINKNHEIHGTDASRISWLAQYDNDSQG